MSSRFAQWGNRDREDVQAVEQVRAELPLGDHLRQVTVRRGDEPHIHLDRLAAAEPLELLLLKHAQQLRLQFLRDIADFVEEQRPAVGQFEFDRPRRSTAPVNAPFSWPNSSLSSRPVGIAAQLSFTNVRDGGGCAVDAAGDQFLAGTRFARDEHGGIGWGDHVDLPDDFTQRGSAANDFVHPPLGADFLLEVASSRPRAGRWRAAIPTSSAPPRRPGDQPAHLDDANSTSPGVSVTGSSW